MIIFADCDNTICESRQKISPKMKKFLSKFPNLIVVGGLNRERLEYQLDGLKCTILAQSGNDTPLWQNKLNIKEVAEIKKHIKSYDGLPNDSFFCENRGNQISYSFKGHNARIELKKKFDPDQKIRKQILKKCPFKSKTLKVTIAGTTCLDYTKKNGTKGKNIARWIKENKLNKKDCVYFGDALFKGGNDESVKGIIKTVSVVNPTDLMLKLKKYV